MTTTTPDVPLPPGAVFANLWEDATTDRPYRRITSEVRSIEGNTNVLVWVEAIQYGDGSLDQSAIDRPSVQIEANQEALSSRQARELAAALLTAADELDGWAKR
ncbi:hypothetical protein PJK45_20610 [Mycobacterium kansasii]|uniref:Uncharacterized protein n=4 Tax=Mycobacterium kansasii TaxID=1768 RepID=A0A7G1IL21_MYCKA|nr:hypothetical protein [Mycobacterium kansasii]UCA18921.1 hypothetical protein LA359_22650 [Mycobacterium kansasii]UGT78983.1 hypothetical protein LTS70_14685 [Mycobacterium kansasii]UGT88053.1 hypothetical protein LTT71_08080 [Mycobacterium kansasii]UGU23682.1 hypothetical protein LT351_19410 [Mycobacterium kansasii]VAZ59993.1 hypothetical protein LAUMK22_01795 [Mycobacterium kansasii]